MPVVIGAKRDSDFNDPIGMLSDCHRRIERFLSVLSSVAAERSGDPLEPHEREAVDTALRYFRNAAPKHTADEEESLFPRLRASRDEPLTLDRMASLEADHDRADVLHAKVDELAGRWMTGVVLAPPEARQLAEALTDLTIMYQAHIAIEETEIFPSASSTLSAADLEGIGREMAARRSVTFPVK